MTPVLSKHVEGKTITRTVDVNIDEGLILVFTDGTYLHLQAKAGGYETAELVENPALTFQERLGFALITQEEADAEAERLRRIDQDRQAHAARKREKEELERLEQLIRKYPDHARKLS